ncbi:MAG: L,D-transpeptidase family protein [Aliarcobacter skirrowii]|uniref:L,D-transpeptidase family protein n=1 Tax=Aliarcobacter skirrowii TaxID=28200 RepID=UPI0024322CA2|nr:L,D-transpeptidase family protein [Aliarcobacter skirrowii]MDD2507956.1 L,D-transpeptidase family protein [Aliarcobacter skirrowii]MDD3496356.1 L,D-transpeptidase family protein [Aliarcobacter skirrowii]
MNKILLFIFLSLNLFAKDYFTIYKNEGIKSVENELKLEFRQKESWLKYLQNHDTRFGYYETKKFIIVADKNDKTMALYKKEDKNFIKISSDSMIIGENLGDKLLEGDKKTPEGSYELIQRRISLPAFYGPLALVTQYPDTFDKSLNKTGHGIWIHGMPLNGDRELYTEGCLAISNDRLELLDKNIDYKNTILITSSKAVPEVPIEELAIVLSTIFKWKDAWKDSDIETYLSFYSKDFKRADRSDFSTFSNQKRRIFAKNEEKVINLFNIDISPYPNSLGKNMYKILMDEEYFSPSVRFIGKKELYIELINGKVEILSED